MAAGPHRTLAVSVLTREVHPSMGVAHSRNRAALRMMRAARALIPEVHRPMVEPPRWMAEGYSPTAGVR